MVKRVSCILKIDLILPIRTKEYGSMGCGVFKPGIKKIEKFLLKNQRTQRKLLNFEFWIKGEL